MITEQIHSWWRLVCGLQEIPLVTIATLSQSTEFDKRKVQVANLGYETNPFQ